MSLQYLITFGDSWPAGAELLDCKNSFPNLLAKQLNVKSINLSIPGTSTDRALYKLLNTPLDNYQDKLILFCLTGKSRSMIIDTMPKEIHPASGTSASVAYYKYIHSDALDEFNCIRNILSAQQYCRSLGCKILFVSNWDKIPKHRAIDQNLFYNKTLTEILNIGQTPDDIDLDWDNLSRHEYITPNSCHPNIAGHGVIATELSSWIKEKLNDKSVS